MTAILATSDEVRRLLRLPAYLLNQLRAKYGSCDRKGFTEQDVRLFLLADWLLAVPRLTEGQMLWLIELAWPTLQAPGSSLQPPFAMIFYEDRLVTWQGQQHYLDLISCESVEQTELPPSYTLSYYPEAALTKFILRLEALRHAHNPRTAVES